MKEEKYRVGNKFITNEGYEIEIIEKVNPVYRMIEFNDEFRHVCKAKISHIGTGGISNPYHKSFLGIGYLGYGKYSSKINNKATKEYICWQNMLKRCYDKKFQEKQPYCSNVSVCKEWHNFQNFAKFYKENYPKIENIKFQLDKDLLQQNIKNKIYSPDTCVFLPQRINSFTTNKKSTNTSGYMGVDKVKNRWKARINCFKNDKIISIGTFLCSEEAYMAYKNARVVQAEHAKDYLRSLNYLPEEIIQLIK